MFNKKMISAVLILIAAASLFYYKFKRSQPDGEVIKEIKPAIGAIQNVISTTGTVLPRNRLEVRPSVNGRIDEVLVEEGERIKAGQTLAWMSSTERAALLDSARGQNQEALEYWKDVYKPIPLIAPIDGEVIVAKTQPGQTVTTSDPIIVLSDRLIVRAQVDETDIGKIKPGQIAEIALDAYQDAEIKAAVSHIYYESKTVNNVTIYEVDLLPEEAPEFFRSGMNAAIDFIVESKESALLLPAEAVIKEKGLSYVLVREPGNGAAMRRAVETGISDGRNVEVVSGISADDTVISEAKKYALPVNNSVGTNPFLPPGRQRKR
ncbi:MAG: efflux RND transporter periplasmic adaptor subunit [Candidatus Omnitrophica bacterium]|nr:efflux RND transporter periplasmic adaptor subunit [Candidatus Omnitrophota bacterium]